jgi:hypothetical protein
MAPNVERNPTRRGEHIGYDATGFAFRIRKVSGRYLASPSHLSAATDGRRFTAGTLSAIGAALAASTKG